MSDAKVKEYNSPSKSEDEQAAGYKSYDEMSREDLGFDPRSGQFPPIPPMYVPQDGN
jgi:hypothetical protein